MMRTMFPDCSTFSNEVRETISNNDIIGERRYRLKLRQDQERIEYSLARDLNCFIYAHIKWFTICELYTMVEQIVSLGKVHRRQLTNTRAGKDTCNFRAMGNLVVYLGYATDDGWGKGVYRRLEGALTSGTEHPPKRLRGVV
jgi:hypothetical protein